MTRRYLAIRACVRFLVGLTFAVAFLFVTGLPVFLLGANPS